MNNRSLKYRIIVFFYIVSQFSAFVPNLAAARTAQEEPASSQVAGGPGALSISRVQSSYMAGSSVIEFTITNDLPPTRIPDLSASTNPTETVGILSSFVLTDDMNTLGNISLSDTLLSGTTLVSASGNPVIAGSDLTWDLPDIHPQGSVVVSMTVQTPAQGPDFIDLDTGAQVDAEQWGDPVSATARPAVIIPSSVDGSTTEGTVDADVTDADMLLISSAFDQDPLALFAYVQEFGYDPYQGSLRGTRGTLWGEAGNSADQSSLLIAMLRAAGVPARYRHGTLSTPDAQTLIGSMFSAPVGLAGTLPAGTAVSDPVNDAALIALVADHWWVEAYLPGSGWTDLDPSFSSALPGDVFAAPGANDRIAELPADERHTITLRLIVEQYSDFPVQGSNLVESIPLEVVFPTAQLAAKRLTFAHLVTSDVQSGVFTNVIYDFTPYFAIEENDTSFWGDTFQDFISSFPLSSSFTTAEWLEYEIQDPNGNVETFSRTVKDLIGPDVRILGGTPSLAVGTDSPPFATTDDLYVNWILPNTVPEWVHERHSFNALARTIELGQYGDELVDIVAATLPNDPLSPADSATYWEARRVALFANENLLTGVGLDFAWATDQAMAQIESGLQTKMYYPAPRVFTVASVGEITDAITPTVDLRRTTAATIVYPGQADAAALSANWAKGLVESELEGLALEAAFGVTPITTSRVFEEMTLQGIDAVLITPADAYLLDAYPFSGDAKALVTAALIEGKHVLIPGEAVDIDGLAVFAWWEIDPLTGETVSVMDNGLHPAALPYRLVLIAVQACIGCYGGGGNPFSSSAGDVIQGATIIGEKLVVKFESILDEWAAATQRIASVQLTSTWRNFPAHLCPIDNCGVEQFFLDELAPGPIPLPDMHFAYAASDSTSDIGRSIVPIAATLPPGAPLFTLAANPAASAAVPTAGINFQAEIESNFNDDFTLMVYAPDGWDVTADATGNVNVVIPAGTPAGPYAIDVVAQSQANLELVEAVEHTVTVNALDSVLVSLNSEANLTVPMGDPVLTDVSNQTNDGETEAAGAAYTALVSNPGQTAHTYSLSVTGPPAGWTWLNGEQSDASSVTIPAGGTAQVGLYIQSPDGSPPAPGTNFSVNISAISGGLSDSAGTTFSMPSQPFNYLTFQAGTLYVGASSSLDFSLAMTNIGNDSGSFTIAPILPPLSATLNIQSPINLNLGETQVQSATLTTTALPLGLRFPLVIGSAAPGSYTQYALAEIQVVSDVTESVFRAADNTASQCTLGEPGLSDALKSLALAMVHLEASCLNGDCDLALRDQTVAAANSVVLYASAAADSLDSAGALMSAAADLAPHTENADIQNDLAIISAAVTDLEGEICAWTAHNPALSWTPGYRAALVAETAPFTLELENEGTLTTTYNVTVTLPSGTQHFTPTLTPSETFSATFLAGSPILGLHELTAQAAVPGTGIARQSLATLNVVDRFVQLTRVQPNPDFVESGAGSTTVFIDVSNIANVVQQATARTTIEAPAGGISHTGDTPVTVLIGAPRTYELETIDTTGWAEGVYTVTVDLLDASDTLIPDGSSYGYLGVGQAIGVSHAVFPAVAAPGTITVTTMITTELLVTDTLGGGSQVRILGPGPQAARALDESSQVTSAAVENAVSAISLDRTEDVTATISYSGTWTAVSNIFSSHTSGGSYTWSNTPGDMATFVFTGTWVHVGFASVDDGGQAEIFVDGFSQGTVDLYAPIANCFAAECLKSVVIDGLADTSHTLEIVVTGLAHPNSFGTEVRLDFIDTWDGTTLGAGTFEQDHPAILRAGTWFESAEPAASGGSYMHDGAVNNNGSVWFPFEGDSASFVALADIDTHRLSVWVDGVWQGNVLIYNHTAISRTFSFSGFGAGAHVMRVNVYKGEPNIDAFITPAIGPDYDPPVYTGLVRYEEDHPALLFNGYSYYERPRSWSIGNAAQASDYSYVQSSTLSDTVSLTFDGSWLNIGLRTRNRGGLAEVTIDGVSHGLINAYSASEDTASYQYNLITGTHTVTITVLAQSDPVNIYNQVYLDYIEIWDGSLITHTFQNARRSEESGRVHVSNAVDDGLHANALQGDFSDSGLPNSLANVWYSFIGDSFTFYGLTEKNGGEAEVYVDGVLIDTVSFDYPYSVQPFAFHYLGFGPGPHSVRVHNVLDMRVDGFESGLTDFDPFQPIADWWDDTPAGNGAPFFGTLGIVAGMAAGDLDGDGTVEIVVPADDLNNFGTLFVYRGDGQDAGGGSPIIWSHDFGGGVYRTWVGSPALADLDGLPGSEIVVPAGDKLYAFHSDGSTYWITDTVPIFEALSSPAIGNLDLDPEPEIVLNADDFIEIRNHDGSLVWSTTYPAVVNPPVLADLTGDGLLDILVTGWDDTVLLYEFNFGSPQLVWTRTLTSTMAGTFGAPAIANIDGNLPGGDPGPEVVIAHNGAVTVLNGEDGTVVWTTPLDAGDPGGVSIADLDGDNEVEIVTGMKYDDGIGEGRLYALNADGSILWWAAAYDSSSANNASTLDLDGDGIYEVAWNGKEQGFTIFSGLDGSVLFNEPEVHSRTGTDYPLIVDVDNDGHAEIIVASLGGLRVFGNGMAWGEARPLWNQHSYHITNVNDDLSIPFSEPNNWESHNTYRTQWDGPNPMPVYAVSITHTAGITGVQVLTDTFNLPPDAENDPAYGWDFKVSWETTLVTHTFDVSVVDLQPGESRLIAQGTVVNYSVPGGQNQLVLPPLYVSAPHIISLVPPTQPVYSGGTVDFDVVLSNPANTASQYTLTTGGLPAGWSSLAGVVNVPAQSAVTTTLSVTVPMGAAAVSLPFIVDVSTDLGAADQVGGVLEVMGPGLEIAISPPEQSVATGGVVSYTLTLTNLETVQRTYDLTGSGLAPLGLPSQIVVSASSSANTSFTAQAVGEGPNPFTILAAEVNNGGTAQATAAVIGEGFQQVAVAILPGTVASGPGVPAAFTVKVTNLGTTPETYDLSVSLPGGWDDDLTLLGEPVSSVLIPPGAAGISLDLMVTSPNNQTPGDVEFDVSAQSQSLLRTSTLTLLPAASATGTVQVGSLGVDVTLVSGPTQLPPNGSGTWQFLVTNTGQSADTYDLAAFGALAVFGDLSQTSVTLSPGGSQTIDVGVDGFGHASPGQRIIGLHAQSQSQANIENEDHAVLTVSAQAGLEVEWRPAAQSLDGTAQANFTLIVTNTGNISSTIQIGINSSPSASVSLSAATIYIPPHATVFILVNVIVPGDGTYTLTATVDGGTVQANDIATLTVSGVGPPPPGHFIYIPIVEKAVP
jgi:uncharacterized membrane protein